jgi:ATP-binding cassette, subfamily F, member 3
MLTTE